MGIDKVSVIIYLMYLDKKDKNRFTVGKQLRRIKQLRKKDPAATPLPLSAQLQAYKDELLKEGLVVGPLEVGLFQTSNGLKYPGFMAKEKILANSVLLRVPAGSLLTTRDAFLSQIQKVFIQNPKYYSKTFSSDWEDRILLTYLLYEHQKGHNSRWFHLLQNLPKDIDYVALWPHPQLDLLDDSWLKHSIQRQRQKIENEQEQLLSIIKRYPQWFDPATFTPANITWIHVHLVTRCFGKYFEYTTMVPYAQLFNHQCVDVYYTMYYKEDNPHNPHQEISQPKELTPAQEDEADTSQGSYEASDVSCEDEDFEERELNLPQLNTLPSVSAQYNSHHSYIMSFISFNDEVSLPFLEQVYAQMQAAMKVEDELESLQRMRRVHPKLVKYLKLVKQFYCQLGSSRYSYGLRQRKAWKEKQGKKEELQVEPDCNYFEGSWPKDKFDEFLMVCGSKDQFEQGSQVYFCYGRLPNRLLLMRYGIALQHNKYNHLFIRIDISQLVYKHPHLQRAVQMDIALRKYKRFKVKRTTFCLELLTFQRSLLYTYQEDPEFIFYVIDLQRQIAALRMTKRCLEQRLESFSYSIQQNEQQLLSKELGYHEYFAAVYRLEQQRILLQQLKMVAYATHLVQSIRKGDTLENLLRNENNPLRITWQIMMESYLKTFKHF